MYVWCCKRGENYTNNDDALVKWGKSRGEGINWNVAKLLLNKKKVF